MGMGFPHSSSVTITKLLRFSVGVEKVEIENRSEFLSIIVELHKSSSWKSLAHNFRSVKFSEPMIQNILLQLKEPFNSRKALNFFHWCAKGMGLEHGLSSYSIMIHILAKSRLVKDARILLESVLNKKFFPDGDSKVFAVLNALIDTYTVADSVPFVFDLFVQTYAKLRMSDDVLSACKLLFDHGFMLSVISFNTLLHVTERSGNFDLAWRVYEHMLTCRISPNEVTLRIMVDALRKSGKLEKFLNLVSKMHGKRCSVPMVIVNTFLVYEMIGNDRVEEGVRLLRWMMLNNMILDTISCSLVVFAKMKMGDFAAAQDINDQMLKRGFPENAFVCSLYVEAYSEKGRIDEAIRALEEMEKLGLNPTEEAMNQLIKGCSILPLDKGLLFCKRIVEILLQQKLIPSCSAVNDIFEKLCENGKTKDADEMLTTLVDMGFKPDESTYSHLVCGYGKEGKTEMFLKLLYEMKHHSGTTVSTSINLRLSGYGRSEEARIYFEVMKPCPSPVTMERH